VKRNRNLAARAGRWSSQHRKKAIFGWLAFVILAVFIGGSVGTRTLTDEEYGIGESGRADKAAGKAFPDEAGESVLVQSKGGGVRPDDPAFKVVVADLVQRLETTTGVGDITSPYDEEAAGQISKDGRSALVTFDLPGDDESASDLVDGPLAAVAATERSHAGFRVEEFGDASADKALSDAFEDDFQKAEVTALPITLIILILAFGALLAAFVPLLLAITAVAAAIGLIGPISQIWPVKEAVDRGASTEEAVSTGIKSTAGVVSAAALVMVAVFSIFATLSFIDMKQFGVGLGAAVLIDATLVRGVLLPASMKLLGDWNWYLPERLDWLPRIEHEPQPQASGA